MKKEFLQSWKKPGPKRLLLLYILGAVILLSGSALVGLYLQARHEREIASLKTKFERIEIGMNSKQVEELIGRAPDDKGTLDDYGKAEEEKALSSLKKFIFKMERDESNGRVRSLQIHDVVTNRALAQLQHFGELRSLEITVARITDDEIIHLDKLTKLESLSFVFTSISGKGLQLLAQQSKPHLKRLCLCCTEVSDDGLPFLEKFSKLQTLYLDRERCTEKGVGRLQKALPKLTIERGNGNTADQRLRKYFHIPVPKPVNEAEIKTALFSTLPLGSSRDQVRSLLKTTGAAKDRFTTMYDQKGSISCGISYDPESGYIVQHHYFITFSLDENDKLNGIVVKRWMTGP